MTRSDSRFQGFAALVAGAVMFSGQLANASSGTWTGAENAIWTNSANWSVSPYAGYSTSEKATFDSAGNNNTTLDITGLYSIGSMTFDSPSVAAYTIGTGALNSQTLIMGGSGTYYMTSNGHIELFDEQNNLICNCLWSWEGEFIACPRIKRHSLNDQRQLYIE